MAGQQGIRAGKAFVELYANYAKLTAGLRKVQRKLKRFGSTVSSLGKKTAMAGAAIAVPLALSLRIGAQFSDQMSKVKAVTEGTVEAFEKLEKSAKRLGRTTSFTANAVAEGMVELGRAGFSRDEIDLAIAGMLDLSRATDTELAEATGIAAAALRQFNLDADQTGRVVDVLTATANGSAQTLTDLGESLKYVAPIASEAGETIEEIGAALGIMANNSIKGSMAGTALARAYKNLSSDKTKKTLAGIGVSAGDASGNLRPMADILNDIGKATENMGTKQRLNIFEQLFGRGQAANLKLAKSGLKFDDMFNKIAGSAGLAARTAEEMDNNLGGSFRKFISAAEGVAIAISESIEGPVRSMLGTFTEWLGSLTEWIEKNQEIVKAVGVLALVLVTVGGALLALGATVGLVSFAIGGLATILPIAGAAFALIISPIGIITGVAIAAIAAISGLVYLLYNSMDSVKGFGRVVLSVFKLFGEWVKSGILATAGKLLWATLETIWINGIGDINKTWDALKDAWRGVADDFVSNWKGAIGEVSDEWDKFQNKVGDKAQKADEGDVTVSSMTPEEAKKWWQGKQKAEDETPIMPTFAEEETPEAKAAREKAEALQKRLENMKLDTPSSQSSTSGGGSVLRNAIAFLNRGGQDRTVKEIQESNSLLAEAIEEIKRNRLQTIEAG